MHVFLLETNYIDFSASIVTERARELFSGIFDDIHKTHMGTIQS